MTTVFLAYSIWTTMFSPASGQARPPRQARPSAALAQPATLAPRTRVIPDIGRPASLQPTTVAHAVSLEDIQRTIGLHPRPLYLELRRQDYQFSLSITAKSVLESAKQAKPAQQVKPAPPIKPIYDFMRRWGQTAYLYRLLHEAPLEGTSEFQLPMHHAARDPSNNTTL